MITIENITQYAGKNISRQDNCLYISPNTVLCPYISHYCISFPTPQTMSESYTVLPSANSVLGILLKNGQFTSFCSGTSSKVAVVGSFANKHSMLLLVKFRAGGFFPFYGFSQVELVDSSVDLSYIDKMLPDEIINGIVKSKRIEELIAALDTIFIKRLKNSNNSIEASINKIITLNGNITTKQLSEELYYSEKHIRRLFLQCVGVPTKTFLRIARINYVLQLLNENHAEFLDIVQNAGYYDQSHLIHDFKDILNLTPTEYIENMSFFYNAESV